MKHVLHLTIFHGRSTGGQLADLRPRGPAYSSDESKPSRGVHKPRLRVLACALGGPRPTMMSTMSAP